MKKTIITLFIATLTANVAVAQNKTETTTATAFNTSSSNLGIAVGLGRGYSYFAGMSNTPAIAITYDKGFKEMGPGTLGLGGIVGYKGAKYEYAAPWAGETAKWTDIIVAARGTYHYHLKNNNKFDPYGGLMLGVRITSYNNTLASKFPAAAGIDYGGVSAAWGLFIGARYNFSSKVGAFAELGYDIAVLKLGVSFGL
jgi:hypothetical protein